MKSFKKIILAFSIILLLGCESHVILHSELNEQDANQVVSSLLNNGILAKKITTKEGFSVSIIEHDMASAVETLTAQGLPKRNLTNLGDVFKKEGVISSPLEERARYIHALSQELEYTLSEMDGVVSARVHVVLPERVAPGEPMQPSSAAVFIKHEADFDPDIYENRVKKMVASSIPGLSGSDSDKTTVVLSPTEILDNPIRWQMVGPFLVADESANFLTITLQVLLLMVIFLLVLTLCMAFTSTRNWIFSRINRKFL